MTVSPVVAVTGGPAGSCWRVRPGTMRCPSSPTSSPAGVELLRLWPFAMAELEPAAPSIVDRLFDGAAPRRRTSAMSRTDLVDVVLRAAT